MPLAHTISRDFILVLVNRFKNLVLNNFLISWGKSRQGLSMGRNKCNTMTFKSLWGRNEISDSAILKKILLMLMK